MYGYASEIFPWLSGLLNGADEAPQVGAPTQLPGATASPTTAKREAPRAHRSADIAPAARPAGLLGSSAPMPPRRPDLGPTTPAQWVDPGSLENYQQEHNAYGVKDPNFYQTSSPLGTYLGRRGEDHIIHFLRSQGIGVPGGDQMAMPRIDNGPAAPAPQNPTWQMPQTMANVPMPPQRPQGLGTQWQQPQQASAAPQNNDVNAFLKQYLYGRG